MTEEKLTKQEDKVKSMTYVHRAVRRVMSVLSGLAFFALIVAEFILGATTKDIPMFLYILLASLAVVSHERFEEVTGKILGAKGDK